MDKIKVKAFVHASLSEYAEGGVRYTVFSVDMSDNSYILVEEIEVEIERPAYETIVNGTVTALRKLQKNKLAEAQSEVNKIEERIQSLLCIENKPSEVV